MFLFIIKVPNYAKDQMNAFTNQIYDYYSSMKELYNNDEERHAVFYILNFSNTEAQFPRISTNSNP